MNEIKIPTIEPFDKEKFCKSKGKKVLITSEGFEERSLFFANQLQGAKDFDDAIVCYYTPLKLSRLEDLLPLIKKYNEKSTSIN